METSVVGAIPVEVYVADTEPFVSVRRKTPRERAHQIFILLEEMWCAHMSAQAIVNPGSQCDIDRCPGWRHSRQCDDLTHFITVRRGVL